MKKGLVYFAALAIGISIFTSCKKTEGEGGRATIQGKIYNELYDHNNKLVDTEEAREENVYIIYGDNEYYDDDRNTEPDGTYRFNYLRRGDYRIFAYEECDSCDSETSPVEVSVEITDKKETVTAPDIILRQTVDPDDGESTVYGRVWVQEYNGTIPYNDPYPLPGSGLGGTIERVYISYDEDNAPFDNMRTSYDGWYRFDNLIKGKYTIYAFSECLNCSADTLAIVSTTATVTSNGQEVQATDITVEYRGF